MFCGLQIVVLGCFTEIQGISFDILVSTICYLPHPGGNQAWTGGLSKQKTERLKIVCKEKANTSMSTLVYAPVWSSFWLW